MSWNIIAILLGDSITLHTLQGFFFVWITLGCMVSLLHSNRKPVVRCRSKLDTVLEFTPLFSKGHTVYVTVSVVEAPNLQWILHWGSYLYNTADVGSLRGRRVTNSVNCATSLISSFFLPCQWNVIWKAMPMGSILKDSLSKYGICQDFSRRRMYPRTYTSSSGVHKRSYR